jgi:hypothetical protein
MRDVSVAIGDTTVPMRDATVPISDTTVAMREVSVPIGDAAAPLRDVTVAMTHPSKPRLQTTAVSPKFSIGRSEAAASPKKNKIFFPPRHPPRSEMTVRKRPSPKALRGVSEPLIAFIIRGSASE